MNPKKTQYCFNCGDELGFYARYPNDPPECCGKRECCREQQNVMAEQEREEEYRDRRDHGGFYTY